MGRLWLALVVIVALVAPALAIAPHVPAKPRIESAYLEIAPQRTSTGLHDVTLLSLNAQLDRYAATVRITLRTAAGEQFTVETTPDRLELVHPSLFATEGTSHLSVTSISTTHIESEPAQIDVVARPQFVVRCGSPLFGILMLFGLPVLGIVLVLGTLLKMRAIEIERTRVRRETEPSPLPPPAAEEHIRTVVLRAMFSLVAVVAVAVATIEIADGNELLLIPIFGAPVFLVIALTAIMRVINAARAIALLHRPEATARTRHDQLEVVLGGREVTLRSSPKLIVRARTDALPKARV